MKTAEMLSAERAAIEAMQQGRGRKRVLGIDVSTYAGYRVPGIDTTLIFSDPPCMLKDATKWRTLIAAGKVDFFWRKPDDPYTKSMTLRGVLRPVLTDELDKDSPYANVDRVRIITKEGPRTVVRTPAGLGLFVCEKLDALTNVDQGLLSGKHWEDAYKAALADNEDQFASEAEQISQTALTGRVSGEITTSDTQREPIL